MATCTFKLISTFIKHLMKHQKLKSSLYSNFSTSLTNDCFASIPSGWQNELTGSFYAHTSVSSLKAEGCLTVKTWTGPALDWSFPTAHNLIFTFCGKAVTCLKARETKIWKIYKPCNYPLNHKMSKAKQGSRGKDGFGLVCALLGCVYVFKEFLIWKMGMVLLS